MLRTRVATLVIVLATFGTAVAETTDHVGVGIATDRASAVAYLADAQERHALVRALTGLRRSLARFDDLAVARTAGYVTSGACLAGERGGLGVPYARSGAPATPDDVHASPHSLTYEPRADGTLALVGAQFAVLRDAWHAAGHEARPSYRGQPFALVDHLYDAPAYVLFVWLAEPNPEGTFATWHPSVRCDHEVLAHDGDGAAASDGP